MRTAPAVHVACRDGGAWRVVCVLTGAAAAATMSMWALAWLGVHDALPAAALALMVGALAGWWAWRCGVAPPAQLNWDGQQWRLRAHGANADSVGTLRVVIDLGPWMLLRFDTEAGRVSWQALSAPATGPAWPALRSAVYAQADGAGGGVPAL